MKFKLPPMKHQLEAFEEGRDRDEYALLMYLGRGKSKTDIDSTAWAMAEGLVDGWVIIAQSGVHRNWYRQEIPKHWPGKMPRLWLWDSFTARGSKKYMMEFDLFLKEKGFIILCVGIEAIDTDFGWYAINEMLTKRECKFTVDESTMLKNHKAVRTILCARLGSISVQRRVLTGMPVSETPFDFYGQFAVLRQPQHKKKTLECPLLGFKSYYQFKHRHGRWGIQYVGNIKFEKQEENEEGEPIFKNMEELEKKVAVHSYVIGKDPDLPPKIVTAPRYFDMDKRQEKVYTGLRDHAIAELDSGHVVTENMAMVLLLRLQQVTCGYLPIDGKGTLEAIVPGKNPRILSMMRFLEEASGKVVIWCRFTEDIEQVMRACDKLRGETVAYYGGVSENDRDKARFGFQNDKKVRRFVGNPRAGGRGIDLFAAHHTLYYSSYFSNEVRVNSEERVHRHGLDHPVTQTDIAASGTVDERIIEVLQRKARMATAAMKNLRKWLET